MKPSTLAFSLSLLVTPSVLAVNAHPPAAFSKRGVFAHGGRSEHSWLHRRQDDQQQLSPECESKCAPFNADIAACPDEDDGACECRETFFNDFIACSTCDDSLYSGYGGVKPFVEQALGQCSSYGHPVSIDNSSLPEATDTPSAGTPGPGDNNGDSIGAAGVQCLNVCSSVCDPTSTDLSCLCTQAYIDSLGQCLACTAEVISDSSLNTPGISALQGAVSACSQAGYPGITAPSALPSFTGSVTPIASATSGGDSSSSSSADFSIQGSSSATSAPAATPSGASGGAAAAAGSSASGTSGAASLDYQYTFGFGLLSAFLAAVFML